MDPKIEIVEKEFGNVIEIEQIVSMMKMPMTMGQDFTALSEYMKETGAECTVAPYARYVDIDWEAESNAGFFKMFFSMFTKKWHFFSGMTFDKELTAKGSMVPGKMEKRKYVTATHYGPYQNVGKLYKAMYLWAKKEGLEVEPESMEFYMNDPSKVKKSELETILYIPLK